MIPPVRDTCGNEANTIRGHNSTDVRIPDGKCYRGPVWRMHEVMIVMKAGHTDWTLVNAKNCFGELITRALPEGPRQVRRRDDVVVVLSKAEYQRLSGKRVRLKDAILHGPD